MSLGMTLGYFGKTRWNSSNYLLDTPYIVCSKTIYPNSNSNPSVWKVSHIFDFTIVCESFVIQWSSDPEWYWDWDWDWTTSMRKTIDSARNRTWIRGFRVLCDAVTLRNLLKSCRKMTLFAQFLSCSVALLLNGPSFFLFMVSSISIKSAIW